jgi:N-acetylglucosaminyl-diphospho-decaprenol L-rhamnosyltransferase
MTLGPRAPALTKEDFSDLHKMQFQTRFHSRAGKFFGRGLAGVTVASEPDTCRNSSVEESSDPHSPTSAEVPQPGPIVTLVLVTFNSGLVLARALDSVPQGLKVIVVDNNSSDSSVEIAKSFNCAVIENSSNVGFGKACNQAVKLATSEFLFFLNPDVVLGPRTLESLLKGARNHPSAAAIGPSLLPLGLQVLNQDGQAVRFPAEIFISDADATKISEQDTLSGAALLCRRSAFEAVGGFDERFFLYFEDTDLCIRLRDNGGGLLFMHDVFAFHTPGKSSNLSSSGVFAKYRHYGVSCALFAKKHGKQFNVLHLTTSQFIGGLASLCLLNLYRAVRKFGRSLGYLEGWLRYCRL